MRGVKKAAIVVTKLKFSQRRQMKAELLILGRGFGEAVNQEEVS